MDDNKSEETPINRGELFMRQRRETPQETEDVETISEEPQEVSKMTTALIVVLTTSVVLGGTILGFIFGWFASSYYQSFCEDVMGESEQQTSSQFQITPHPEMLDSDGNMIPFTVSKLISVEFEPVDSFDTDPFADD